MKTTWYSNRLSWFLSISNEDNHNKVECKIPHFSASFDWKGILEKVLGGVKINPENDRLLCY